MIDAETIIGILAVAAFVAVYVISSHRRHAVTCRRDLNDAIEHARLAETRRRLVRLHLD